MIRRRIRIPPLTLALGVGGLVPFVVFTGALYAPLLPGQIEIAKGVLLTYAAVILAFLGAVHWGLALARVDGDREPDPLALLWGVTPALVAWLALMLSPQRADIVLLCGFAAQWVMDQRRLEELGAPPWYLRLRTGLSASVILCLTVALPRL